MKMKQLMGKIKSNFFEPKNIYSLNIEIHWRPTTLTFEHALSSFKRVVSAKYPPHMGTISLHVITYEILVLEEEEGEIVISVVGVIDDLVEEAKDMYKAVVGEKIIE